MREIREHFDIIDVLRLNEYFDLQADIEHEAHLNQQAELAAGRRR